MAKHKKNRFCSKCGKSMRATDLFCPACGNRASHKSRKVLKSNKRQNWILITGALIGLAFVITIVVSGITSREQKPAAIDRNNALIAGIAAEFDCSCGKCEKELKICDCPTAQQTFEYIGKQINKGQYSRLEIIRNVNDRYGYLKDKSILGG